MKNKSTKECAKGVFRTIALFSRLLITFIFAQLSRPLSWFQETTDAGVATGLAVPEGEPALRGSSFTCDDLAGLRGAGTVTDGFPFGPALLASRERREVGGRLGEGAEGEEARAVETEASEGERAAEGKEVWAEEGVAKAVASSPACS